MQEHVTEKPKGNYWLQAFLTKGTKKVQNNIHTIILMKKKIVFTAAPNSFNTYMSVLIFTLI